MMNIVEKEQYEILPRWLPLRLACRYAAIGEHRMIELIRARRIKGFKDDTKRKDWIIDRLSIDAYREGQISAEPTPREIALAIMRKAKL
jgi:hypothetical protein